MTAHLPFDGQNDVPIEVVHVLLTSDLIRNGRLHLESDGANPGVVGLGVGPHLSGGEDGFLHDGNQIW